jgi:hypothetical protein
MMDNEAEEEVFEMDQEEEEEEQEEGAEEDDFFPNGQDGNNVRQQRVRRRIFPSDDEDETQEHKGSDDELPATLPHEGPVIMLNGVVSSEEQGLAESQEPGRPPTYLSPFLRGEGHIPTEPTFTLNVHYDNTSDLQEILHLVDLDPKARALLQQIQNALNQVACMDNQYFAARAGARHYGTGNSAQFLPGFCRNFLFGKTNFYLDMTSAWSNGLKNMMRVLKIKFDTPYLDMYNRDVPEFRAHISHGLRQPCTDRIKKAKEIILWAVHGLDKFDHLLEGDSLNTLTRLSKEVSDLTLKLIEHPALSNLLDLFRIEESELQRREAALFEEKTADPEFDDDQEEEDGTPRRKKKRPKKKKEKKPEANVFRRRGLGFSSTAGERVSAIYQVVESEAMAAMAKYFQASSDWKLQILIHDGIVIRPANMQTSIEDLKLILPEVYDHVAKTTGWLMPFKLENMELRPSHVEKLAGTKVFHALLPQQQLIRQLVYVFGEQKKMKRIGRSLLVPNPEFPGLYEMLRYKIQGQAAATLEGSTVDAAALIHNELAKSPYSAAYYSPAGNEKKLMEWFEQSQHHLFEKLSPKLFNLYMVAYKDGLVDFNADSFSPTFWPWSHFEETGRQVPIHFLAYPDTEYVPTLQHIRDYELGVRDDSPTPVWDKFINYQINKPEDKVLLTVMLGRLILPLRDGWNVGLIICGPEQTGKSVILNELKQKIPLGGLLTKVVSSKTSAHFPLGDLSSKTTILTDEAESMIDKLGADVLKSILSNGSFDSDVSPLSRLAVCVCKKLVKFLQNFCKLQKYFGPLRTFYIYIFFFYSLKPLIYIYIFFLFFLFFI